MKITESQLRKIIREEASRLLREGETFALKPGVPMPGVGDRIPMSSVTPGMSDIEGPGAERARAMAARNRKPAPAFIDTLLINLDNVTGEISYHVGSRDAAEGMVSWTKNEGMRELRSIGTDAQWEAYDAGGPHPVYLWLKKHPEIVYVFDTTSDDPDVSAGPVEVQDWLQSVAY